MPETHIKDLEGERVRYGGDTWELTGALDVKRDGATLHARAKQVERVRRSRGTLTYHLQNPPASLNPGNLGEFDVEPERRDDGQYLLVRRPNGTSEYKLDSMSYE